MTLKKARLKVGQRSLMQFVLDNERNVVDDSLNKLDVILWNYRVILGMFTTLCATSKYARTLAITDSAC